MTESSVFIVNDVRPILEATRRYLEELAEVTAEPTPKSGITLHDGKGGEAFLECEWEWDIEHETRDSRPGDPEWDGITLRTIATGMSTGTIRFTAISERYRP